MKKHKLGSIYQAALISVLLSIPIHGVAEDEGLYKGPYHDESTDDRNQRMAWWREARFGYTDEVQRVVDRAIERTPPFNEQAPSLFPDSRG